MAKWDFKIVGASFVKELAPVGDDVNPRSQSFMQPSFDLEGDKIVMKESGQYKTAILFTQIGEIDGVAPTDLEDAYAKLLVLVENFNGGGGAPGTTPSLPQVLTVGDRTFDTLGTREFQITDRTKYLLCFGGEILTLNESIINFPVNSLIQFRVLDQSVSLQVVGTLCYYLDSVTPVTSLNLLAGDYCELKKIDLTNWILTVTNSSNSAVATTGAVISFATPQIYNSIASPSSSNLTDNLTGARIGIVQKIYHNAGTAPTVPAGWVLRGTGAYVTSTLNIIYAEWSVGTTVEYWITQ